jgi:putative ABC transport system substrate-binding protein
VSLLAAPLAADAQQAGKVPRIGFLGVTSASDRPPLLDAFRKRLRELGWVEGQNIVIDYRFAEGRLDRLPDLAAELVRLKVDVIVSLGTQGVTAAKSATGTIPIVMIAVRDPVGTGLIASLARPGGNVTGVSGTAGLEWVAKQLELLKETVPRIRRVAILSNPTNAYHQLAIRELNVAGRSLGVQLQLLEARGPNEFDGAFAAMAKERADALLVLADAIFNSHQTRSPTSQPGAACRPPMASARAWRPGVSCLTGRAFSISTGGPPTTWTRSSRGPSPPSCPSSCRPSSSS